MPASVVPSIQEVVDSLLQRFLDEPEEFRGLLKEQLASLGAEAARYVLQHAPLLDPERLAWAFEALAEVKDVAFDEDLKKTLRVSETSLRAVAIRLLAERNSRGALPAIIERLRDKDPSVRTAAVLAIERLGDERSWIALVDLARDVDEAVRRTALGSATEMVRSFDKEAELARRLIPFSTHALAAVRADIAEALGRLSPANETGGVLSRLLNDSSKLVRARAAVALGEAKGSQRELLVRLAIEREEAVKAAICQALGRVGQSEAVAPLIEALRSKSEEVQRNAADALRGITKQTTLGRDYAAWTRWRGGR